MDLFFTGGFAFNSLDLKLSPYPLYLNSVSSTFTNMTLLITYFSILSAHVAFSSLCEINYLNFPCSFSGLLESLQLH